MSFPILISSDNHVGGNRYQIDLPTSVNLESFDVAVDSMYMYYSWYNVSNANSNNKFSLTIPSKGTFNIVLPDGAYNISTLNSYLQFWFIANGYFITNNTTSVNTYYASFQISPQSYKVQFITTALPTTLPSGFTAGFGFATWPGSPDQSMQIVLAVGQLLATIIGFIPGTFPQAPTIVGGINTVESTLVPNVNPNFAIQVRLSCVYNTFSSNSTLLHVFSNNASSIGSLVNASPMTPSYVPCQGYHSQIALTIHDQSGNPLDFLDKNVAIKLLFKKRS